MQEKVRETLEQGDVNPGKKWLGYEVKWQGLAHFAPLKPAGPFHCLHDFLEKFWYSVFGAKICLPCIQHKKVRYTNFYNITVHISGFLAAFLSFYSL